mmetsp:Transcript_42406/g.104312  ORF Transcript_42406/g.104312 Transcript_42406/m.104312 type:complete len:102 (-) Transcript_42406:184-489(-)
MCGQLTFHRQGPGQLLDAQDRDGSACVTTMFSEKMHAWRNHPMVAPRINMLPRNSVPGLGTAIVVFSIYCTGEMVMNNLADKRAAAGHGGGHASVPAEGHS